MLHTPVLSWHRLPCAAVSEGSSSGKTCDYYWKSEVRGILFMRFPFSVMLFYTVHIKLPDCASRALKCNHPGIGVNLPATFTTCQTETARIGFDQTKIFRWSFPPFRPPVHTLHPGTHRRAGWACGSGVETEEISDTAFTELETMTMSFDHA